ncbi:hypothetical protein Desaci_4092 [Desulfosporosinus acidiphilus SJ4]|uniref:Flp pilus assembly protein TadB n=1 Tax=Desulfosporosinus acidiphilus (strain DSM 22704 / JCM 16185 / SJ4) TaxID=646529 RepID=I4DAY1_DESAJ|nr:hypothetical protein [Desulfosporosinus acidiphilus]AFM42955.1 hypothetical protein Desaci_4092 [Desulfosporosinus acidiphilus SJ4]
MSAYALISSISLSLYTFIRLGISQNDARRAEVFGRERNYTLKKFFFNSIDQISSEGLRKRLATMNISLASYWSRGALWAIGGAVLFAGGFWSLAAFPIGAIFGYFIYFAKSYLNYNTWKDSVVADIGKLITMLKIRLIMGDTVPQAITTILPVLHGNMKLEWTRLVSEMSARKPIVECLDRLMDRINDRSMSAVILRLKTYHREGLPTDPDGAPLDPFSDMGEHLTRIAAKSAKYRTKRMSGSITFLGAVGLISTVVWIIPFLWVIIITPFTQM